MVRIHAAALLWAWAQISSGGNSGASAGSDTRALLTLLCTHEHDASRTSLAHLLMPLFTVVRGIGILGSSDAGSCIDPSPRGARMASKALHAAWRRSTSCGVGCTCTEMNATVLNLCAWTGVF